MQNQATDSPTNNTQHAIYGSTTQLQQTATYNMSVMNWRDKIAQSGGQRKVKVNGNRFLKVVSFSENCKADYGQ